MQLEGKVAIVTGGARGIGRAIVEAFCSEGACVTLADMDADRGEHVVRELKEQGFQALFVRTDVGRSNEIQNMVEQTREHFGKIDILVNNAGILCDDALAEDVAEEEWERMLRIDLTAPFLCSKYVLPYLRAQGGGAIVNIASAAALAASHMDPPYCTAKTGILGLTRSLAYDYAPYRVRANAICPGTCETEMFQNYLNTLSPEEAAAKRQHFMEVQPLGMCQPEDVAYAAVYLASDRAKFVTGIALPVDGGATAI
ncbi:MAG: glucose 1-dehydrogenase [Lachnospiraceae bacterium]|nr:glucose 1-dehydrogenase [Lachnospiraceae bacterium]